MVSGFVTELIACWTEIAGDAAAVAIAFDAATVVDIPRADRDPERPRKMGGDAWTNGDTGCVAMMLAAAAGPPILRAAIGRAANGGRDRLREADSQIAPTSMALTAVPLGDPLIGVHAPDAGRDRGFKRAEPLPRPSTPAVPRGVDGLL